MTGAAPEITVLYFAAARDVAGLGEERLPVPAEGLPASRVHALVVERHPGLAAYARSLRLAVNERYARDDEMVRPGDVVAVIPPVAGG